MIAGSTSAERLGQARVAEPAWLERNEPAQVSDPALVEAAIQIIWQQVLGRAAVAPNADFFDCGGDSLGVIDMVAAIEARLGIALPVTVIYEAPTVASLALLIHSRTSRCFSPLVQVKAGGLLPALFMVHGRGGNIMELVQLGRAIDHHGPIYAIQSRGLDGADAPADRIQDMARDYWHAISVVQPAGPYYFAGYSLGGLIAFELARNARSAGAMVGLLALLDTTTSQRTWPRGVWARWACQRGGFHARQLRRRRIGDWPSYLRPPLLALGSSVLLRLGKRPGAAHASQVINLPSPLAHVHNANVGAKAGYRPCYYEGQATLIVSAQGDARMGDPRAIWAYYVRDLKIREVPGDHFTMLAGEALPRALSECLRTAPRGPE